MLRELLFCIIQGTVGMVHQSLEINKNQMRDPLLSLTELPGYIAYGNPHGQLLFLPPEAHSKWEARICKEQ